MRSDLGAVNLDQFAQLGAELGHRLPGGSVGWDIIGWSATGDRFAVRSGFQSWEAALARIFELLEIEVPVG